MTNKPLINPELYKKINETMPITAIDIILVKDGKFLLSKEAWKKGQVEIKNLETGKQEAVKRDEITNG